MRITMIVCCMIFCFSLSINVDAKLLMKDEFNKIDSKNWAGNPKTWKEKKGALEILDLDSDGNGGDSWGFGNIAFDNFGLQFDLQLLSEPFPSNIDLLFRSDGAERFYQLILAPVSGARKPNHVRWFSRNGDRATWLFQTEDKVSFPVETDVWYQVALLAQGFDFQFHMKKLGEPIFQKVSAWSDSKKLFDKGKLGFHTIAGTHVLIDNMFVYDDIHEVNLAVDPKGKLATTWGLLKQQ